MLTQPDLDGPCSIICASCGTVWPPLRSYLDASVLIGFMADLVPPCCIDPAGQPIPLRWTREES